MQIDDKTTMGGAAIAVLIGLMGFIYAIIAYQNPAPVSAYLSAYSSAWDRSFRFGMLACYGLIGGIVFASGADTILNSI